MDEPAEQTTLADSLRDQLGPDHTVLDEAEVAALLRVRPSTVANLARSGALKGRSIAKHRRYLLADVRAYIERLPERT
jgi:hypothetical protein